MGESASTKLRSLSSWNGARGGSRPTANVFGDERVLKCPRRTGQLIAFVMNAPAGVSKANK